MATSTSRCGARRRPSGRCGSASPVQDAPVQGGPDDGGGFNVERQIKRKQEVDRWAAPKRNIWIGNLAAAGRLEGLVDVRQGLGLDVRPHVAGGDGNSAGLRADYNFSPNVSWANLAQYDNESRIAGLQSRFRWILRPGNDLFLVLNRGWYRTEDGTYLPNFDRGSLKLQYTIRL